MKKTLQIGLAILLTLLISSCACRGDPDPVLRKANSTLLHTTSLLLAGHSILVVNAYCRMPGCYIACYTPNQSLQGIVRVNGLYLDRNCQPQGYFFKDLSKLSYFKEICNKQISNCKGKCWADGNTGRFLGISQ